MTTIGEIENFDEARESWETYVERLQHFIAANSIDEEHKAPTLLSLIGSKTYSLLKDLLAPEKPADKTCEEIVSTLQKHLNPKPLEIAERFPFLQKESGRRGNKFNVRRRVKKVNHSYIAILVTIWKKPNAIDLYLVSITNKFKKASSPNRS